MTLNGFTGIAKIVGWVIVGIVAFLGLQMRFSVWENKIDKIEPIVMQDHTDIAILKNDISYIKAGIDRIEKAVK